MTRRIIVLAIVAAACLLVVTPAFGWNGLREDYTTTGACASCHTAGSFGAPIVYPAYAESKHHTDEAYAEVASRLPYGSVCQGCHTSNFDPNKLTPVDTGGGKYSASPSAVALPQGLGNAAWSEGDIGCSSCHYGSSPGVSPNDGPDTNDTAHTVPFGEMANADICGACHSRYSYTQTTYPVATVPGAGTPTPLIQPQMAIGYPMLGSPKPSPATGWNPAAPLSAYLNIPAPGWSPSPTATPTGLGSLQTYWKDSEGNDMSWQQSGHDGSAAQYPEWASEGLAFSHSEALNVLTGQVFWAFLPESEKQTCLECHSADFRIMKEAGKAVSSADVKYGVTCVGCHTPHEAGNVKGVWDKNFDSQLIMPTPDDTNGSNMCTQCHNTEFAAGQQQATPGQDIHHPMKEMMDGYGAIGVPKTPSVHKGKCIQCHMPPTSYSRGSVQLGGNHTFNIIEPKDAVSSSPIPISVVTSKATALPLPGTTNYPVVTTTVTTTQASMPYSACSTCHDNNATSAQVITSTTATPNPAASPLLVNVTVLQQAAGGDKGLWLQNTIEQRQAWTHDQLDAINADLETAAGKLGFAASSTASASTNAKDAIVAIPEASWTGNQRNFLNAYTNHQFVESEGSYGLHNWAYSVAIINKSEDQVASVASDPWMVKLTRNKSSVKKNNKVTYKGTVKTSSLVAGTGSVQLQKKKGSGGWSNWTTATLSAGAYSKAIKMKSKGTWYVRAKMNGNASNLTAYSAQVKVVVK